MSSDNPSFKRVGVLIVTDDQVGIAGSLTAALRDQGQPVATVKMGDEFAELSPGDYSADLTSPESVANLVATIRDRQGAIGGFVHLLPLRQDSPRVAGDLAAWRDSLARDVKSLFLLSNALVPDLNASAENGGACLFAATGMGGAFGLDGQHMQTSPTQGGVAGFVKTIAQELPNVNVRVIDFDSDDSPDSIAVKLLAELSGKDDNTEVGYTGSKRVTLRPTLAKLDRKDEVQLSLDSSSVILITGGARGITAEVAVELAQHYAPTLVLVGRSPLPAEESAATAGIDDLQQLRLTLIQQMQGEGQRPTPAQVEAALAKIQRDREITATISALQNHGATVRYYQADVRDEAAMRRVIDDIYKTYGRLDGVIHGAGIIEDKRVEDKTPESFDRVIGTKADSAFILSRLVRAESLKFLVFFSSIAARFGNAGQADYAAANEVLNKLALQLDEEWPGRVVSMNWGPWLKGSMVSREVQNQFAERGIELIPPDVGRRMFLEEILYGRKGDVEVIIGGGWDTVESAEITAPTKQPGSLALLKNRSAITRIEGQSIDVSYVLNTTRDLYLNDHRLSGKAVLPFAVALELIAETVLAERPDLDIVRIKDHRLFRGVVIEGSEKSIRLTTTETIRETSDSRVIKVSILNPEDPRQIYYQATVYQGLAGIASETKRIPALVDSKPFPVTIEQAYNTMLFHGPLFEAIDRIEGISDAGITSVLTPVSPGEWLTDWSGAGWWADPCVIDAALQAQLLWGRIHWDITAIPTRLEAITRFAPLTDTEIYSEMRIRPNSAPPTLFGDHYLYGTNGDLLCVLEGVELVGSEALNQLMSSSP